MNICVVCRLVNTNVVCKLYLYLEKVIFVYIIFLLTSKQITSILSPFHYKRWKEDPLPIRVYAKRFGRGLYTRSVSLQTKITWIFSMISLKRFNCFFLKSLVCNISRNISVLIQIRNFVCTLKYFQNHTNWVFGLRYQTCNIFLSGLKLIYDNSKNMKLLVCVLKCLFCGLWEKF